MFGGFNGGQQQQNNNNNGPSVNTKIRTIYGDTACLQLSYWNENISIKINPYMGLNDQGVRQYDFNRRGSTALTPDKCIALSEKIKEVILPEINKVKDTKVLEKAISVGLNVGNKGSILTIEYKDSNGVPSLFLNLYTNIGQDNKPQSDGVYSYKFTKTTTLDNYDPESGTTTGESTTEAEFLYFYEKIKSIADAHATAAQSIAVNSAYKPRGNNGNYQNNGYQGQPGYQGQQSVAPPFGQPSQNSYTAPVSTFTSEDMPF